MKKAALMEGDSDGAARADSWGSGTRLLPWRWVLCCRGEVRAIVRCLQQGCEVWKGSWHTVLVW